jgi:hypothetical protein
VRIKVKPLKFEAKTDFAPGPLYLRNTISLKGLKPGLYDLEIILRDELMPGSPAIQTVKFEVIPSPAGQPTAGPYQSFSVK